MTSIAVAPVPSTNSLIAAVTVEELVPIAVCIAAAEAPIANLVVANSLIAVTAVDAVVPILAALTLPILP